MSFTLHDLALLSEGVGPESKATRLLIQCGENAQEVTGWETGRADDGTLEITLIPVPPQSKEQA